MPTDLAQIVHGAAGKTALVVGDLILDRYLYGDAERISPEAPVPVLRTVETKEAVGGSANVCACLRALHTNVIACGVIGQDGNGEMLSRLCRENEIDLAGVLPLADRPTTTKTRLVGLAQHRHRQQLLRVDEEDTRALSAEAQTRLVAQAIEAAARADVICIEDYDKGVVTRTLVEAIVDTARRRGTPVLVDPARLRDYDRYHGVNLLTPNRDELAIAAGRRFDSLDQLAAAAETLRGALGADGIVTTVDRDGAVLVEAGHEWRHVPTVPRSVYDNTGAGDAVLAMLAAAVAAGADLHAATRLANIAGGLEVEKFGCVPITSEEVLAELRLEDRMRNGKLRTIADLLAEVTLRRDRGETVAFTNGCFDILHAGHVELLKRCRREASMLVVGLNSDASVRALNKAPDRPINRFENRATVLSALECVDYVVGFDEATPEALIRRIRPDALIKGADWANRGVVGREFVETYGGKVILAPLIEGLSTTNIVEQLRRNADVE